MKNSAPRSNASQAGPFRPGRTSGRPQPRWHATLLSGSPSKSTAVVVSPLSWRSYALFAVDVAMLTAVVLIVLNLDRIGTYLFP